MAVHMLSIALHFMDHTSRAATTFGYRAPSAASAGNGEANTWHKFLPLTHLPATKCDRGIRITSVSAKRQG